MESMGPSGRALSKLLGGTAAYVPVNSKTNMSSLRPSLMDGPSAFIHKDTPQPPIRLQDQSKVLESLDKLFNATHHPMLDTEHMFGRGNALAPDDDIEPTVVEAREILEQHIKDRQPYFMLASKRLQTVLGTTGQRVFDLPFHISPKPEPSPTISRSINGSMMKRDSAVVLPSSRFSFESGVQVDPETGKGLREWLLGMGRTNGSQRKQECKSISFHDLTPNAEGVFSNALIAHFAAGDMGRRVDVYEVELPITILDPATGKEIQTTEQWLWFLISQPLITLSPKDKSTVPAYTESEPDTPRTYYTPSEYPESDISNFLQGFGQGAEPQLQPPPNFPHPIPPSWVVFACPGTNITAYPSTIDPSHPSTAPKTPAKFNYSFLNNNKGVHGGKITHKRKDYDFSHQGIPMFEFSGGKDIFFAIPEAAPKFLSVDSIGRFHPSDLCNERDRAELSIAAHEAMQKMNSMGKGALEKEKKRGRDREAEVPGKFNGQWWDSFVEKAYEDAAKWEWVKKSMVDGKCRVVVRWAEWEADAETEEHPDLDSLKEPGEERDEDRGIGLGLQLGEDEDAMRKKRKVSRGGKSVSMGGENTRVEAKRRSALSGARFADVIGGEMNPAEVKVVRGNAATNSKRGRKRGSKAG